MVAALSRRRRRCLFAAHRLDSSGGLHQEVGELVAFFWVALVRLQSAMLARQSGRRAIAVRPQTGGCRCMVSDPSRADPILFEPAASCVTSAAACCCRSHKSGAFVSHGCRYFNSCFPPASWLLLLVEHIWWQRQCNCCYCYCCCRQHAKIAEIVVPLCISAKHWRLNLRFIQNL